MNIRTDYDWLLQCGEDASPVHRESDIHGLDPSKHALAVLQAWFVKWFLGPLGPRLKTLVENPGDEVEAISSHDIYSYQKYAGNEKKGRTA